MGGNRKVPMLRPLGNGAECLGGLIPSLALIGGLGRNAAAPNNQIQRIAKGLRVMCYRAS